MLRQVSILRRFVFLILTRHRCRVAIDGSILDVHRRPQKTEPLEFIPRKRLQIDVQTSGCIINRAPLLPGPRSLVQHPLRSDSLSFKGKRQVIEFIYFFLFLSFFNRYIPKCTYTADMKPRLQSRHTQNKQLWARESGKQTTHRRKYAGAPSEEVHP